MSDTFELGELWQAIADSVKQRSTSFSRPWKFLFEINGQGHFCLDVGDATIRPAEPREAGDAAMITDLRSLAQLAHGTLDPGAPQPGQVCILTGNRQAWEELGAVLSEPA